MVKALIPFVVVALLQSDEKQADEALKQFNAAWKKASRDEGARASAVTALSNTRHEKILDVLIEKLDAEKSVNIKESLVAAISQYDESDKAANCLAEHLEKNGKLPSVMQKLFQGLGTIKAKHTRPHVAKVNEHIKHKDMSIAVPAVSALGTIRDKSSIVPLLERLRKAQQDMREYIRGANLPNCDGD